MRNSAALKQVFEPEDAKLELQIIPFYARHVRLIRPDAPDDLVLIGQFVERSGHGFTACVLGDPVGAAGLYLHECSVAEAWMIISPFLKQRFAKTMYKLVKNGLEEKIKQTGVKRVIAYVDPDDETAIRFIKHLGFHDSRRHQYQRNVGGSR